MIAAAGAQAGGVLTLDAPTLRRLYDEHRAKAEARAKSLATYALGLARRPEFGSVRVSKTALPERMADLILDDLRERGAEEVGADRPIAAMLVSVFRVT